MTTKLAAYSIVYPIHLTLTPLLAGEAHAIYIDAVCIESFKCGILEVVSPIVIEVIFTIYNFVVVWFYFEHVILPVEETNGHHAGL
jgi:hypothetical protein